MLIDDLIASRDLAFLGSGRAEFIRDLRKAHRFDLDDAFTAAADQLGTSRPSAFERAIGMCKPPYDFAWFETSQAARKRFSGVPPEGSNPIKRIGILMQAFDGDQGTPNWLRRWAGVLAWSFPDGGVSVCGMAMLFDGGPGPHFPEMVQGEARSPAKLQAGVIQAKQKWHDDPAELPAVMRVAARTFPVPTVYFAEVYDKLLKERGKAGVDKVIQGQLGDWSAEEPFWLGVLSLLNSRNASIVVPGPDLDKLNKARRKRQQDELLTYSICKLAPKLKARIDRDTSRANEIAGVRAHFVRGHFKVRESGIFWWSPFLRGDRRLGFADKDYRATGGAA